MTLPVLHLVSCVSEKLSCAAPARDLYRSQWFAFARAAVEREWWAILSAKHGLLWPDAVVEPYDESLATRSSAERKLWAGSVLARIPSARRYVLWAGSTYAEFLAEPLLADVPMRGLGIGQQLAYLKARARN
jgi:hypothetical protein